MTRKTLFKIVIFKCSVIGLLFLLAVIFNSPSKQSIITEKKAISRENFELDEKLQSNADQLLFLFDNMPPVKVFIKDEPIIKSGTNTERGVAYTSCKSFDSPKIFVKKTFYQTANQKQLANILKHELTHAWLCRQGQMSGHNKQFREKFKQVGGFGN